MYVWVRGHLLSIVVNQHQVDWSEWWVIMLASFHVLMAIAIILTRREHTVQIGIMMTLGMWAVCYSFFTY